MTDKTGPTLQFLGATGTVTGSRYLVRANGRRILIDCGLFQGDKSLRWRNRKPFPVRPRSIDTVLLTHAHLDHSGYLPALVRSGFAGPILYTPATRELCGLILPDSGHLQEEEAKYAKQKGYSEHRDPNGSRTSLRSSNPGKVPCVDGSVLSRDLIDDALLVGAAMCSAC